MAHNLDASNNKLEVWVFLFLIVPSMLFSYIGMQTIKLNFVTLALSTIFRDLGLLFLVLFFLWHNGEGFEHIGLTVRKFGDEAVLGGFLFFPLFFLASIVQHFFQKLGLSVPEKSIAVLTGPKDTLQLILAAFLLIIVAITEETIFRGYLIRRFEELTRSKASALFISTAFFALGHGYEGVVGVSIVSLLGLVYGLVFIWRGSLIAPMVMHFLQNYLGLIQN